jgi:TonB family protein
MSTRFQVNPTDLLGQAEPWPRPIHLRGSVEPKLEVVWNAFHQNFLSGIPVFFQRAKLSKDKLAADIFRDCHIDRRIPRRGIIAAVVVHFAAIILPWPQFAMTAKQNHAFDNTELTWSGPIVDLPQLNMRSEKAPAHLDKKVESSMPAAGADVFHPRQRIFTDPAHPTHPRQTLINPAAPMEAPKILPNMPNVVQLAAVDAPARPHVEISEKSLAKLKPRTVKSVATSETPSPDLPNLEQRPADISLAIAQNGPAKPKLEINAGSAPRLAAHAHDGEVSAAPEVAVANSAPGGSTGTLIALSSSPAPPAPVVPPAQGNLAARVAISPEGKQPGVPGGSSNGAEPANGDLSSASSAGSGKNAIAISISGGSPKPNASVSGLSSTGRLSMTRPEGLLKRPGSNFSADDQSEHNAPPNFASIPAGNPPEQIFSSRQVYSLNVNMPNLNSATGSWIIHFSELRLHGPMVGSGELSAPVPVRKVDPKYPSSLMEEHVEGEVILYGVIRQDGSVDSVQLVRSLDPLLDANSMSAFSEWKFRPATRGGQPVDLEAIIHIPFHAPERH